ncbi:biopolymer transporter ExbD [Paraglaciecola sp. L3A3]|uniref:ExbD/TolR family protein n=1 Tax=Paraglaciecola sp. L3A3 TaxID=2686358 RepID=UPI00131D1694|nr:biopolymer transporter ExbD [Paraglaciecola sp. L3A3]
MLRRGRKIKKADAELDITSFMNLMIVLVPVLLMMMVFSKITVLELKLPALLSNAPASELENKQLELIVNNQQISVYYPAGYLLQTIEAKQTQHDLEQLQQILKQLKQTLLSKGADKKDIVLMLDDTVPYQTIVHLMDTTRSYQDVIGVDLVDAELFPEISFADAPTLAAEIPATNNNGANR